MSYYLFFVTIPNIEEGKKIAKNLIGFKIEKGSKKYLNWIKDVVE